jgi:uncharacterized protein (TIGR03083 family)
MKPVEPIETVELFPELSAELLRLLKNLPSKAWDRPTPCATWSVKDVVAHLLGGNLGRLSFGRDRLIHPKPNVTPKNYAELVDYLNQQNKEWVNVARRISPRLLIDFLELTDPQLYQYFKALPPFAMGGPAVAWAGDNQSPNWFDIAREYTEKWLHQQHVREAVRQPLLVERKWLYPVLDTFMRALPHTYRDVKVADGVAVWFHISGQAGGDWSLLHQDGKWQLCSGEAPATGAAVYLDQDVAWRLFTKGISQDAAQARIQFEGDAALGMRILEMVSIMA